MHRPRHVCLDVRTGGNALLSHLLKRFSQVLSNLTHFSERLLRFHQTVPGRNGKGCAELMATQCGIEIGKVRIGPPAEVGRAVRRPGRRLHTDAQRHRPGAGRRQRRLARPSGNGLNGTSWRQQEGISRSGRLTALSSSVEQFRLRLRAGLAEQLVRFGTPFDGPRLDTVWSMAHFMPGNQQPLCFRQGDQRVAAGKGRVVPVAADRGDGRGKTQLPR